MKKKVFILLPDGVGLRNFAFTKFKEVGEEAGFDIVYWNNTVFPLKEQLGYEELKIEEHRLHKSIGTLSRARKRMELALWQKKFKDKVYPTYRFPLPYATTKNILKSVFVRYKEVFGSTEKGVKAIRKQIKHDTRKSPKYNYCKAQLKEHRPDIVFCTNQRPTQAIPAILAAQDLGIPTATWIFSWDNLPKATMVIETDHYFVWSAHMKKELHFYYPFVRDEQVFVTGTPQFEPHYDTSLLQTRAAFCEAHGLSPNTRYLCFSGDDITTSPLDQYYLEDTAIAVRKLKEQGEDVGIIYRKVPIDFTGRYDAVLEEYKDVIVSIDPLWKPIGERWDQVMPTKEDFKLLVNVCHHSEFVCNIASSMVFDFVIHKKPCLFFDYEQPQLKRGIRDIGQNYKYVHFRSMPNKEKTVVWSRSKEETLQKVNAMFLGIANDTSMTHQWYQVINRPDHPAKASERIWDSLKTIIE